ncbi:MAG: hypothetical protein CFE31_19025 [Rhizobiales bacterium PAR1]|nr:MAG: hypothetical protein CFE31_19025 [Rhizobiales bacterium PAR1]
MSLKKLPLNSLVVNRANDRHGELENETAAIAWLFNHREGHMKQLAKDLVDSGQMYEAPLVFDDAGKFIVFDGNRRITCLKLIANPKRAPNAELQRYFSKLKKNALPSLTTKVTCQVESDRDRIDEILYRRHTGAQAGVGQSAWDDRMKNTFVQRTGKGDGGSVADEIEKALIEAGLLAPSDKIPRSNMNRLLSAEVFRNRVGVSFRGGMFNFTHNSDKSLAALARVASDLSNKKIVLGDIWDVDGKNKYLDRLDKEGVLPAAKDLMRSSAPVPIEKKQRSASPSSLKVAPQKRTRLISDLEHSIAWSGRLHRHREIWEELQYRLELDRHPNAISVLMRVLIELSVENCISQLKIPIFEKDKLSNKIKKACTALADQGKVDKKTVGIVAKFDQAEHIVSADTLNRYVHSQTFAPSPEHICSIWDALYEFVVACLNS